MNENKNEQIVDLTNRIHNAVAEYTGSFPDGASGEVILNALIAASAVIIRNMFQDDDQIALRVAQSFARRIPDVVLDAPRVPGR